jgi:hypothetical protein
MQLLAPDRRLHQAVTHGWRRLVIATRPHRRRRRRDAATVGAAPVPAIDPVALTVLAVNRLGPATLRTVANGRPLTVTVPNAGVGAIFRAALAEMQKTRATDRLIDIVIAADDTAHGGRAANDA